MIKPILSNSIHLLLGLILVALAACSKHEKPVQLLFDTDFGGDADDLGALAMLNHFHNKGEAELLGVFCWNAEQYAVSGIDAVNTYYGNPDIPIGLRQTDPHLTDWNHSTISIIQIGVITIHGIDASGCLLLFIRSEFILVVF